MSTATQEALSVDEAKAEFGRAVDRLKKVYETTPDDKINWSPAGTARTPTEVAAHCAMSIKGMQGWLAGEPFPFESMKALDDYCRTEERNFTTRAQVLGLLDTNTTNFLAWLDSLSHDKLASMFDTPMGSFPMMSAITFPADHLRSHAAQIDYIQTIYGDREMHM
ncbi:MAG TPA: DinB family protein [Fimbriimonadaceae bacterium]|nr:DinB family protein [Fimbriimonadaceae bacterium]